MLSSWLAQGQNSVTTSFATWTLHNFTIITFSIRMACLIHSTDSTAAQLEMKPLILVMHKQTGAQHRSRHSIHTPPQHNEEEQ